MPLMSLVQCHYSVKCLDFEMATTGLPSITSPVVAIATLSPL